MGEYSFGQLEEIISAPAEIPVSAGQVSEVYKTSGLFNKVEAFLDSFDFLVFVEEFRGNAVAFISTFTYGEIAIFVLLLTWYLTYLLFKFWSIFR